MATETNQVVQNSSEMVAQGQETSTGASGGSAGVNPAVATAGSNPPEAPAAAQAGAPVVAPKGFRVVLQQMLQGWSAVMPPDAALQNSAGSLTSAAVISQLQGYAGSYTTLDAQATGTKQARVLVKTQLPQARKYIAALKAALRSYFGEDSPQLEQFGLKPRKAPTPLTSEQRAVRAAKARATRALRSTKGPVQKLGTKSGPMAVTVSAVVPVAAESPPAVSQVVSQGTSAASSPLATK